MNAEDTIRKAADALGQAAPGAEVILFGSHARGEARPDSDIDLLVVEPDVPDQMAEMARLSAILGKLLIPADVVVLSRARFERDRLTPNTLAYHVQKEGTVLNAG